MTAPSRLIVLAIALLLTAVPAAHAATSLGYDAGTKLLTITNGGEDETFTVTITNGTPGSTKVTVVNTTLAAPAGSGCSESDANKTLTCLTTGVTQVVVNGGGGKDAVTVAGSTAYSYSPPTLQVNGDAGDDTFTAGEGSHLSGLIRGGADNDTFNGSPVFGESFSAEAGNDTYNGGTAPVPVGADPATYQLSSASDSFGASAVSLSRAARRADTPVNLSLDGQANDSDGLGGTDNLIDLEALNGTVGNDTLSGGATPVRLYGAPGDDVLTGSPGPDSLSGNQGNDIMDGSGGDDLFYDGDYDAVYRLSGDTPNPTGDDTIKGGDGDDIIIYGAGKDDVSGGGGTDTAYYSRIATQVVDAPPSGPFEIQWLPLSISMDDVANDGPKDAGEGDNLRADVENLDTTGTSFGSPDRSASLRRTRAGFISIYASRAADTITGSGATNEIRTGLGNDSVDAGLGADVIDVGGGDDQVNAVDTTTDIIRCGAGTDNAGADLPGTNAARADVLSDCENVTGTPLGLEGGVLPTLPGVKLGGPATIKSKGFLKKWTIGVKVTSDQPASVAGELTTTQATISKVGALSIGSGKLSSSSGTSTLKLKVAKKFRKRLKGKLRTKKQRKKGIKLTAVVTVTNATGQVTRKSRTIKIKG